MMSMKSLSFFLLLSAGSSLLVAADRSVPELPELDVQQFVDKLVAAAEQEASDHRGNLWPPEEGYFHRNAKSFSTDETLLYEKVIAGARITGAFSLDLSYAQNFIAPGLVAMVLSRADVFEAVLLRDGVKKALGLWSAREVAQFSIQLLGEAETSSNSIAVEQQVKIFGLLKDDVAAHKDQVCSRVLGSTETLLEFVSKPSALSDREIVVNQLIVWRESGRKWPIAERLSINERIRLSALSLTGLFFWKATLTTFESWVIDAGPFNPCMGMATMNCNQLILASLYIAGVLDKQQIREMSRWRRTAGESQQLGQNQALMRRFGKGITPIAVEALQEDQIAVAYFSKPDMEQIQARRQAFSIFGMRSPAMPKIEEGYTSHVGLVFRSPLDDGGLMIAHIDHDSRVTTYQSLDEYWRDSLYTEVEYSLLDVDPSR